MGPKRWRCSEKQSMPIFPEGKHDAFRRSTELTFMNVGKGRKTMQRRDRKANKSIPRTGGRGTMIGDVDDYNNDNGRIIFTNKGKRNISRSEKGARKLGYLGRALTSPCR